LPTPDEERAELIAKIAGAMTPRADLDPTSPMFASADEAANAAFGRLVPNMTNEQAGVIYKTADGQFAYSIPTTQNKKDDFALQAIKGNGQSLAGIYHTHPGDDSFGQMFSPHDIEIAKQLAIPSYVQFLKDAAIRAYVPGKTRTWNMTMPGSRDFQKVAKGDPLVLPQQVAAQ
jgi:hypothetical protein